MNQDRQPNNKQTTRSIGTANQTTNKQQREVARFGPNRTPIISHFSAVIELNVLVDHDENESAPDET